MDLFDLMQALIVNDPQFIHNFCAQKLNNHNTNTNIYIYPGAPFPSPHGCRKKCILIVKLRLYFFSNPKFGCIVAYLHALVLCYATPFNSVVRCWILKCVCKKH